MPRVKCEKCGGERFRVTFQRTIYGTIVSDIGSGEIERFFNGKEEDDDKFVEGVCNTCGKPFRSEDIDGWDFYGGYTGLE